MTLKTLEQKALYCFNIYLFDLICTAFVPPPHGAFMTTRLKNPNLNVNKGESTPTEPKKTKAPVVGRGGVQSQSTDVSRAQSVLSVMASVWVHFCSRVSLLAALFVLLLCLPPGGGQKKKEVSPAASAHGAPPRTDAVRAVQTLPGSVPACVFR